MHPRGIVKLPRARIGLVVDPRRHLPELLKALEQSLLAGANDKSPIEVTLLYQLARILTICRGLEGARATAGMPLIN